MTDFTVVCPHYHPLPGTTFCRWFQPPHVCARPPQRTGTCAWYGKKERAGRQP